MWKVHPRKRIANAWKVFEICTNHWGKCQNYDCEICNWFSAKFDWYWEVPYRKPDEQKKINPTPQTDVEGDVKQA